MAAKLDYMTCTVVVRSPGGEHTEVQGDFDGDRLQITVGCRTFYVADAKRYWSRRHPEWRQRRNIPSAIKLIEKKLKGFRYDRNHSAFRKGHWTQSIEEIYGER